MEQIPELQSLREAVEARFKIPVKTTAGFERLSAAIEFTIGESLGASTLKRLWGYIPSRTTPRLTTLDILSRYAGHKDFKAFCASIHAEDSSDFLGDRNYITAAELSPGDRIRIGWPPNRLVTLSYLGDDRFEVLESLNARLRQGDRIEVSCLLKGWPLFVPGILRSGTLTPPYIAGKAHGLTILERL
jgi:hypothetical protein